jgi:hypothetical protein
MRTTPASVVAVLAVLVLGPELHSQAPQVYVVRDAASPCLNLRTQPRTDSQVLDRLRSATPPTVVGTTTYWRKVKRTTDATPRVVWNGGP